MTEESLTPNEYTELRRMIISGTILPNERIVEAHYAELLKTNRANIRKALARLEQDGLIVSEPFRGARVRRVTPEEAVEIFEVRGALEVLITQHAARLANDDDKARLRTHRVKLKEALARQDAVAMGRTSRQLREEIWRISRHETASRIVSSLNSQLVRLWFQSIQMPGRMQAIVDDLGDVIDSLEAGSSTKAAKSMRQYHDAAIKALKASFDRQSDLL